MKVKELIDRLSKADPDAEVWIEVYPVDEVEADEGPVVTLTGLELQKALGVDP